jgi:hypothetical protein
MVEILFDIFFRVCLIRRLLQAAKVITFPNREIIFEPPDTVYLAAAVTGLKWKCLGFWWGRILKSGNVEIFFDNFP